MDQADLNVSYGGLGRRVVAYWIDVVIEAAVMLPAGLALGTVFASFGEDTAGMIAVVVAGLVFDCVYFTCFESSPLQGTPGKRLLGMAVVDLAGNRLSLLRASARYGAKTLSAVVLFVGFLQIGFSRRKQGLHDVVAGTLVVRRPLRAGLVRSASQAA